MGFRDHLTQSLTRRRVTQTPDSGGGYTPSNADLAFTGLIVRRSASASQAGGREQTITDLRLYYPPDLDLIPSDLILDAAGNVYFPLTPNDVHGRGEVGQVDLVLKTDEV